MWLDTLAIGQIHPKVFSAHNIFWRKFDLKIVLVLPLPFRNMQATNRVIVGHVLQIPE